MFLLLFLLLLEVLEEGESVRQWRHFQHVLVHGVVGGNLEAKTALKFSKE